MEKTGKNGKQLAELAGISKQSFSAYKDGSFPNAAVLAAWSVKLGLSVSWLLLGEGAMLRSEAANSATPEQERELQDLRAEVAKLKDENYKLLQELVEEQRYSLGLFRELLTQDREKNENHISRPPAAPKIASGQK